MKIDDNLSLSLLDESLRLQLYAHIADMDGTITSSSTIRGLILPKQIGSHNSLIQFIDVCLISFAVLSRGYYAGLAGFLPQSDPISREASFFMLFGTRQNKEAPGIIANFLVDYAFSKLGMHRVSVSVLENDQDSLDIFRGLQVTFYSLWITSNCYWNEAEWKTTFKYSGFTQEGIKRKAHWADGAWLDIYIFGVIDEEWKKLKEAKGGDGRK